MRTSNHIAPVLLAAFAGAFAAPALASSAWDETVNGDLATDPAAPTPIAFSLGSNTVTGTVQATGDTRDYLTFTIAEGQQLAALLLLSYTDLATGQDGNRGFYAFNVGNTSAVPGGATANFFLAGNHLDPVPAGFDLLTLLAPGDTLAGPGITGPLGAGTYTFLVQQTGPQLTGYSFDFVITPAPGAAAALAVAGVAAARRRR